MSNPNTASRWTKIWDVPHRTKTAAERHLAVLALGTAQALRQRRMSAREAWESGLNFRTYLDLRRLRADRRLLELWRWAMELPQVEKLGSEAFGESIDVIEKLASAVLADHQKAADKTRSRVIRGGREVAHSREARAGFSRRRPGRNAGG